MKSEECSCCMVSCGHGVGGTDGGGVSSMRRRRRDQGERDADLREGRGLEKTELDGGGYGGGG